MMLILKTLYHFHRDLRSETMASLMTLEHLHVLHPGGPLGYDIYSKQNNRANNDVPV